MDRQLDASALRDWAHTAVSDLITHIDEINRLNVFPVADSDTGANMLFTMRSALAEANAGVSADGGPRCVARVASALSAGALNGARGNSGVILSQILRGIADVTAPAATDAGGELLQIDAVLLGAALRRGVELVITSMGGQEVPGTIVSVLRAAAGAVEECAAEGLATAIIAGSDAAVVALEKTTEQLDVLADAGAVDAGGRGLLVLLDALSSTVTGQTAARTVYELSPRTGPAEAVAERPGPQFEVMYLLDGCDAAAADVAAGSAAGAGRIGGHRRRAVRQLLGARAHRRRRCRGRSGTGGRPAEPHRGLGPELRHRRIAGRQLDAGTGGAGRRRRQRRRRAVRRGGRLRAAAGRRGQRSGHRHQRSPVGAGRGGHRCRAGDGAAQRLCGRRGAGGRLHRGHRLGNRRGADTDGVDGAGTGRAGRA